MINSEVYSLIHRKKYYGKRNNEQKDQSSEQTWSRSLIATKYLLTRVSIEVHDMRGISMIVCSHFTEVVRKVISNWIITTILIVLQRKSTQVTLYCRNCWSYWILFVNNVQLLIYGKPGVKSTTNKMNKSIKHRASTRSSKRKIGSKT